MSVIQFYFVLSLNHLAEMLDYDTYYTALWSGGRNRPGKGDFG